MAREGLFVKAVGRIPIERNASTSGNIGGGRLLLVYHSPIHPNATSPAAAISQQTQNQKDGSKTNPVTASEIVARTPEIIFGILLFIAIFIFWKSGPGD